MKEEQIIEVARELFHKFGFKKVSMDEIAREAGVTKKTIYRYFDSKEALLEYFIQEELQNMKAIIEKRKRLFKYNFQRSRMVKKPNYYKKSRID